MDIEEATWFQLQSIPRPFERAAAVPVKAHVLESPPPTYAVEVDFDGASRAWRANKAEITNGIGFVSGFRYLKPGEVALPASATLRVAASHPRSKAASARST
jgi:hypothetical protein